MLNLTGMRNYKEPEYSGQSSNSPSYKKKYSYRKPEEEGESPTYQNRKGFNRIYIKNKNIHRKTTISSASI